MDVFYNNDILILIITAISLLVSVIVLFITYKTYILKYGQKVRGWVGESSSIISEHKYYRTLLLENLKDKDLVVFDIYIRIGHNIYLDMLDKDNLNEQYFHIIPALSTKEFRFGPPIEYVDGTYSVNLSDLIFDRKTKTKIILSTNQGKLIVKSIKNGWNPVSDYFKNYGTSIIRPIRYYSDDSIYGRTGKEQLNSAINYNSYGSRTLYLITLKRKNFGLITYPIMKDCKVQYFEKTEFTDEVLENTDVLREFILSERSKGTIEFDEIDNIFDFRAYVKDVRDKFTPFDTPLKAENWFTYNIIDRLQTYWYKYKNFKHKS